MPELIERLRKDFGENGSGELLEIWWEAYKNSYQSSRIDRIVLGKIIGFLHGLNATGYISYEELADLLKYL